MNEQSEIKKYFDDFLEKNPASTRKKCPPPGKLVKLLRLELAERKRNEYIDHIAECGSCAREFKSVHGILKGEAFFDRRMAGIALPQGRSQARKGNFIRAFFINPSWGLRAVLLAAFIVLLSSPLFFILNPKKPAAERASLLRVSHLVPDGRSLSPAELAFRWEAVPDSVYYTVEIFDDSLKLTWRSGKVLPNRLAPSLELMEKLEESRTYLWMVTAVLENGSKAESGLAQFTLKKQPPGSPRSI